MLTYLTTIIYSLIICLAFVGIHISIPWRKDLFYQLVILLLSVLIGHTLIALLTRQIFPEYAYIDIAAPFGLFYGPMSYYLLKAGSGYKFRKWDGLHLLPLGLILPVFVALLLHKEWREAYIRIYYIMMYSGIVFSWLSYMVWAITYRGLYRKDKIGVVLKTVGWAVMFILSIFILSGIPYLFGGTVRSKDSTENAHLFVFVCMLLIVWQFYLLILGHLRGQVGQTHVVDQGDSLEMKPRLMNTDVKIEYKKYVKMVDKFIADKLYLDSSMNIEKFASSVNIPKSHLPALFQDYYKTTFNHFINQLRIQYACRKLEDVNFSVSVEELADKCGFRSRASFYRNFNQEMSCTPLEYRKRILPDLIG